MKRIVLLAAALLISASAASAADQIDYEISFANRVHHEAEVTVHFRQLPAGPLIVRMSRTSPGRYALHEFGKNVYGESAADGQGRPLHLTRSDAHEWAVDGHSGEVVFRYTVFGDRIDGTYLSIDETHAHLNIPATFVWARGLEGRPVRVRFHLPEPDWRVATQLKAEADGTFTAPDLAYFLDSPTELSAHRIEEWTLPDGQTVALAIHHEGSAEEARRFAEACRAVVDEQIAVFGEAPRFDYGRYVFIADYLPHAGGDGMEHRNSTILTTSRLLGGPNGAGNLGTVAHEFFHAWNVERLRPRSLEPFDFEGENPSAELWFAEGFTSYYGPLTVKRAGLTSLDAYARSLGMVDAVVNSPGRRLRSPMEMSRMAAVVDGARWRDPTNIENTFLSYYTWGAAVGLALDLSIRSRFPGRSLDDLMRSLWESHGRAERPFDHQDLRRALAGLTSAEFADDFFSRYVEGREAPDFAALLEPAGLLVRSRRPDRAWPGGASLGFSEAGIELESPTLRASPLYAAGLEQGDRLTALDGSRIASRSELDDWLDGHTPGQRVEVEFERRGAKRKGELTLMADPGLEVVPFEHAGRSVGASEEGVRAAWLGARAPATPLQRFCPVCRRGFPFEFGHCHFDGTALQLAPAEEDPPRPE